MKTRQTAHKSVAQVLMEKGHMSKQESDLPKMRSGFFRGPYEFTNLNTSRRRRKTNSDVLGRVVQTRGLAKSSKRTGPKTRTCGYSSREGEHQLDIIGMNEQFFVAKGDLAHVSLYRCDAYGVV